MDNPFPELARKFVESDDSVEADRHQLASEAARYLQESDSAIQAFNNFITAPGQYIQAGEDESQIARARAYRFLASTIQCLPQDFLQNRQVTLLVNFLVSVYNHDVRGGVAPATDALLHLMKDQASGPKMAIQVLEGIPKLGDDFKKQDSKTRRSIYELVRFLIQNSQVVDEVERTFGQNISFMSDLLKVVQVERDASCLLVWFEVLQRFLALYNPAPELTKDIFELFSASYFPISIRNSAHPSGITTNDLKLALRACFTAHNRLAEYAIPFLLEKLDGGEVSKAEVKLDILQTLDACIQSYTRVDHCVVPFVDSIWTNLRFEVRNGEVESTITATLQVLRSLGQKLSGTDLVRFCTTVLQDCLGDLNNPNFTAQAGKLLMSVLSAKSEAFGIIVTPTLGTVQSELRHATSAKHIRQLMSLIKSIISLRTQQRPRDVENPADVDAFEVTIPAFQALYGPLRQMAKDSFSGDPDADTLFIGMEAATALAGLAVQLATEADNSFMLDPESVAAVVRDLLDHYIFIVTDASRSLDPHPDEQQDVHYQLRAGLQLCTQTHPSLLDFVLGRIFSAAREIWETASPGLEGRIETLLCDTASISTLVDMPTDYNVNRYVVFVAKLLASMNDAFKTYQPEVWTCHVLAAQEAWICVIHAWQNFSGERICPKILAQDLSKFPCDPRFEWDQWVPRIRKRYPALPTIQDESAVVFEEDTGVDEMSTASIDSCDEADSDQMIDQSIVDIQRLGLYVVRELYRKITEVVPETHAKVVSSNTRFFAIELADIFTGIDKDAEDKFLVAVSQYAMTVVSKLHVRHQMDLFLADEVIALFHSNEVVDPVDFQLTRKTEHITKLVGRQIRDCLMSPPDQRLEEMLSETRMSLRCPPMFPISGLKTGRIMTLSYGVFAALASFPNSGIAGGLDGAFEPWSTKLIAHRLLIAGLVGHEHPEDPIVEGYLFAMLASLGNKFQVESMKVVSSIIPKFLKLLADPVLDCYNLSDERFCLLKRDLGETNNNGIIQNDGAVNKEGRVQVARRILAVIAGMLRRPKNFGHLTGEMADIWKFITAAPKDPLIGHRVARAMEVLFSKNDALQPELHSHINSLWLQRTYHLFVESWISNALPTTKDKVPATNCTIAALGALVNMHMAIWESQVVEVIKMCLCVMTTLPIGPDLARAVHLLRNIHNESPDVVSPFLDSVIIDCLKVLQIDDDHSVPEWLPEDFLPVGEAKAAYGHVSLACVSLLGDVALKQDRAKLQHHAHGVCRELGLASAVTIREVRNATIKARQAWDDVLHDRPARE